MWVKLGLAPIRGLTPLLIAMLRGGVMLSGGVMLAGGVVLGGCGIASSEDAAGAPAASTQGGGPESSVCTPEPLGGEVAASKGFLVDISERSGITKGNFVPNP